MHLHLALALTAAAPTGTRVDPPGAVASGAVEASVRDAPEAVDRSRGLRAAGYVAVVVGGGSLGTMLMGSIFHTRALARREADAASLRPGERLGPLARMTAQQDLTYARIDRNVAIAAGVTAAASLALATTFFVMARNRGRTPSRLSVVPTWLPSGAGLALHVRLR